jgi:hypothetical protein
MLSVSEAIQGTRTSLFWKAVMNVQTQTISPIIGNIQATKITNGKKIKECARPASSHQINQHTPQRVID